MNYKFKTKPYQHQLKLTCPLKNLGTKKRLLILWKWEQAKLKFLLIIWRCYMIKGKIDGALIVAPKGVVSTWCAQEIPAHLATHIEYVSVLWQANITQKQKTKLDSLFQIGEELHIFSNEC